MRYGLLLFCFFAFLWAQSPNDIIINEYRINDDGTTQYATLGGRPIVGDWLELLVVKNNLDIRGWRVTDNNTKTGTNEGSLIFPNTSNFASLPMGTYILIVAEQNATNDANFIPEDTDPSDKKMILYVGGSTLDVSTDPGFNIGVTDDDLVILDGSGTPTDFTDDVGIDFVAEGTSVTPASFGIDGDGVVFTNPFSGLTSNEGVYFTNDNSGGFNNDDGAMGWVGNSGGVTTNFTPAATNTGQDDSSLPVTLVAFTAQSGNGKVILRWITESEINNLGFEIYRATARQGHYVLLSSYTYNPNLRGHFNSNQRHIYEFVDNVVANGQTYYYKLVDVDVQGFRTEHGPIAAMPHEQGNEVLTRDASIPVAFRLYPNFPNPFNPATTIRFDIPELADGPTVIKLTVYNGLGQKVKELYHGQLGAGSYQVQWTGKDEAGRNVPSGLYFVVLQSANFYKARKMMLMR